MSIDRGLLELAAKAADIKVIGAVEHSHVKNSFALATTQGSWNPLTDDGDAFRLAVKLKLLVVPCATGEIAAASMDHSVECIESCGDDPYAATRRAIVRAAAEIGRTLK